jgi:hypothetical protein
MNAIPFLDGLVSTCSQSQAAISALCLLASASPLLAQGAVTFDARPFFSGTNYFELGVWFRTAIPPGSSAHDNMVIVGPIPPGGNAPERSTPYMGWFRQFNPFDYVAFSLTNGGSFGLTSVQLADPSAPSFSLLPITFLGHKFDGSSVTNTFTTPGNGANTFLTYHFSSQFASGLTSVDIQATRWAMDDLVFTIPEPSTSALFLLGLLGLVARRRGCPWRFA